jgi:hypothetical protein
MNLLSCLRKSFILIELNHILCDYVNDCYTAVLNDI